MSDPTLYLYAFLTGDSSHEQTPLSRISPILEANNLPYREVDLTTNAQAREIWARSKDKNLPALVKEKMICGADEITEWDRRGELVSRVLGERNAASPKHMIPDLNNGDTPRKHWRPSLPTRGDLAVQSSDNFQAANVHDLGLLDHHKKSTVTSIPEEERGRLAHDLRRLTSASSAGEIGEEEDAMEDR